MRTARAARRAPGTSCEPTLMRSTSIGTAQCLDRVRRDRSPLVALLGARVALVARPEEPIGKMLAHAGTIGLLESVPRVILRLANRLRDVEPVREHRRERRGERASGAVIAERQPRPRVGAHDAALAVERVDDLRRRLVGAGDENEFATALDETRRAGEERRVVVFHV